MFERLTPPPPASMGSTGRAATTIGATGTWPTQSTVRFLRPTPAFTDFATRRFFLVATPPPWASSTGKQLSFVYDVADLYKAKYAIPIAFREAAVEARGGIEGTNIDSRVRRGLRDLFRKERLMEQILPDIAKAFDVPATTSEDPGEDEFAGDESRPAQWWQPDSLPATTPIGSILASAVRRPWK